VLERHAPPHVVANAEGEIVYFSSRTGRYLETPAGVPTRNLASLAKKGIRARSWRGVPRGGREERPVTRKGLLPEEEADGALQR
jgi:two-component system, chemotaxis family, CheB/CheR fusion protein